MGDITETHQDPQSSPPLVPVLRSRATAEDGGGNHSIFSPPLVGGARGGGRGGGQSFTNHHRGSNMKQTRIEIRKIGAGLFAALLWAVLFGVTMGTSVNK